MSPVYTAVSDANGRLNIGLKPYIAADGKLIQFDADPTVSAGYEKYRFWVDQTTIPEGYQLQYITGEQVIFPQGSATITQGGSGSNTAKNTHENWKILFMQKPKAEMHRTDAKETPVQSKSGGYMTGKVSWDYKSGVGGVRWYEVAQHTKGEGAKDVTVRASYLSDYAMKKIYSDEAILALGGISKPEDIRGPKWTSKLEDSLQKWIKEQVKAEPEKWIAETVTAKTDAEGEYIIQFNGTWGVYKNSDAGLKSYDYKVGDKAGGIQAGNKWTQEQIDRLGTVADSSNNGAFDTLKKNEIKHINYDWLFVSTDGTENLRVMTPYNNNYYTSMNSDWGIHAGWSDTGFGVGVTLSTKCILRSDFVFGPGEIDFHITNYDNEANTAIPGDIAQTSTTGLPYSFTSGKYQIIWYGPDGKEVKRGTAQQPLSTGTIASEPFDTSGVTKTTEYTAKLHRVDSKGNLQDPIAIDSFTVEVSSYVGSRYDDFEHKNEKPIKGAAYSAENLPDGLTIDAGNGNISGKPTTAGLYDVKVTASMDDTDQGKVVGKIEGSRTHKYLITDSPLADGAKGTEYNQKVVPTQQKGYVFKNVTAKFIDGKEIAGLTITGDQISGTPTAKVEATEEEPNVQVTYDVYRKNDKGEEVLIKEGHIDKVPLSIKDDESSKYEPAYADKAGKAGVEVTTDAPTFKDADGKDATAPKGTKYTLGDKAPKGATIDENTGKVTYTPKESEAGKPVEIPVVVTYPDKSTDDATAKINVEALPDVIDRTDDPSKQTPDGYVRVTFTNGKGVNKITNNKVYDVKEGTKFVDKYFPQNIAIQDGYKGPVTWAPADKIVTTKSKSYGKDGVFRFRASATKIEYTTDEVIPYLPDEKEPDKGSDGKDIPADYITVTFKSEDEAKGTVKVGEKTGVEVKAKVKPGTNLAGKAEAVAKEGYGFTVWAPELGVAQADQPYVAKFIKSGDEVKADDPIPTGWHKVTVKQDATSIAENTVTEKTYAVKPNDKLAADKFPSLTDKEAEGYENPAWYVDGTKVENPADKAITAETTFIAKAALKSIPGQTDADKYTPKGQDITVNTGETPNPEDGIANKNELPTGTTYSWKNDEAPSTGTPGVRPGTVVVTYPDNSTDEVPVNVIVNRDGTGNSARPIINQPTDGDTKVTGTATPGAIVTVTLPDGTSIDTTADDNDGKWSVGTPVLNEGEIIKAYATERDLNPSDPVTTTVKGKVTPTPTPEPNPQPWPDYPDDPYYPNYPGDWYDWDDNSNTGGSGKTETKSVEPKKIELDVFSLYVIGNEDRLFMPNKGITRAEIAQIFARALGYDGYQRNGEYNPYSDLNTNAWYYDAVITTTEAGLFRGTDKGTFDPNREITKAELIATIARFQELGIKDGNTMNMRPGHWALGEVEAAYQEGWLDIYTRGLVNFDADMVITRAEVVAIFNRAFGRIADIAYIDANADRLTTFKDVNKSDWFYYDVITAANTYANYGMEWLHDSNGFDNEFTNLDDIKWDTELRNDKEVIESLRRVKFQRNAR